MKPIHAGAFELLGISGVSLASGDDMLGIRMAAPHPAMGLFDDKDVLLTLEKPDTYAPDQRYVRYTWRVPVTLSGMKKFAAWPRQGVNSPTTYDFATGEVIRITLEWGIDGEEVVGRYSADCPLRVALFANGCVSPATIETVFNESCTLLLGNSRLQLALTGNTQEPFLLDKREQAEFVCNGVPVAPGKAMVLFPVDISPESPLYFRMRLSPRQESITPLPAPVPDVVDAWLQTGAKAYDEERMRSSGDFTESAEAIAGLAGYSYTYDPKRQCVQTTVNRTWGGPNSPGLVFGWDNFFDSYIAAWENPALGAASLEHIVKVYGERGIENGPVQRNLIIPVVYCRTLDIIGDEALARRTWPTMMSFMRFWFKDRGDGIPWRDSNGDGLIEPGTCADANRVTLGRLIQDAMDETGYDELPNYSAGFTGGRRGLLAEGVEFDRSSQTLTITLLCQNSLYCAACRTMAQMADRLGMADDAAWLRAEEQRVAQRIRESLYDPQMGIFRDRLGNGDFSPAMPMTLFYPLLAGLCDGDTSERLKSMLLDPTKFWGENLIPTVSRDDASYCDGLDGAGNYWRGNCWPPTTYIVYLAIKEAGWDDIATEYARRTYAQFMKYWQAYGHAYENYPPEGDVDHRFLYVQPWGGRELRYVWAAMLLFCGLEEVFGPETIATGLRFGNPYLQEETRWKGFHFGGVPVEATAGPTKTDVKFGTEWSFVASPGVAVRKFTFAEEGCRFTVNAPTGSMLELESARCMSVTSVTIDGQSHPIESINGKLTFSIPPGRHDIVI